MAGRKEVRGLPWCQAAAMAFPLLSLQMLEPFYFIFLKLRFAQESYLVGSDVGK